MKDYSESQRANFPIGYASKLGGLFLVIYLGGGVFFPQLQKFETLYWIYEVCGLSIFPLCAYFYSIRKANFSRRDFGWQSVQLDAHSVGGLIIDTLLLLFIWFVCFVILYRLILSSPLSEYLSAPDMSSARPAASIGWFVVGIYWCIQPALIEETFFRGFLKTFFDAISIKAHRTILYSIVSGVLFGIGHLPQGGGMVVASSILGFAFCIQYARIRRIGPFVAAHFAGNFYALFMQ